MKNKIQNLPGVSLVELIIVVAIIGIMTTVYLGTGMNETRNRKQVETEAQKFVSAVKHIQNLSLTGKIMESGKFPCRNEIQIVSPSEYQLYQYVKESPSEDCAGVSGTQYVSYELENGVEFSSATYGSTGLSFGFHAPFGGFYSDRLSVLAEVQLVKGSGITKTVCVCGTGKTLIKDGNCVLSDCS